MLNFKFGKFDKFATLPGASSATAGTVYVTTDEQAMYIDLPKDPSVANSEFTRVRIGDIIVKSSSADLGDPPYSIGVFYYLLNLFSIKSAARSI
jgi:hypothetical protein